MAGKCSQDAERFKAPLCVTPLYLQFLAANAECGYRIVKTLPLTQQPIDCGEFVRAYGRTVPARDWSEDQLEAVRLEDEGGNIHVYSMYDRACEFFGVPVLALGQLPVFKAAAALGIMR